MQNILSYGLGVSMSAIYRPSKKPEQYGQHLEFRLKEFSLQGVEMAVQKLKAVPGNWQVIIRFSLDYDKSSAVRNALAPVLKKCGIARTKTGTWQSRNQHCSPVSAGKQLRQLLRILQDPQARVDGAGPHAKLDHIWFYIERIR